MKIKTLIYTVLIITCFFMLELTPQSQAVLKESEGIKPGKIAFIIVMDGVRGDFFNETIYPNVFDKLVPNGVLFTNAKTVLPAITTVAHASLITGAYPNVTGAVATSTYNATAFHIDGSITRVNFGSSQSLQTETLLTHADDVLTLMIVGKNKLSTMKKDLNENKGSYFKVLPGEYQETTIIDYEGHEKNVDSYSADFPVSLRLQQDSWIINETMLQLLSHKNEILNGRDTLVVLNLPGPDWAGHAIGCLPDAYHPNASIYRQVIENVDAQLGRLIAFLEENGLDQKSSFFITADHGFHNVLPGSTGLRPILSTSKATAFDVAMNTTFFSQDLDGDGEPDNKTYQNLYVVASAENSVHLYLRYPEKTIKAALQFLKQYATATDFGSTNIFSRLWIRDDYIADINDTSLYNGTLTDVGMYTETAGDIVIEYKAIVEYAGKTFPGFKPEFPESLGDHGVSEDLHIPLLMSGAGFENNITENSFMSITDIAPTAARLLGLKKPLVSKGKVWEEYFIDEGVITEINLDSVFIDENTPTTIEIAYETYGSGPYTIRHYILDKEFNVIQQGNDSISSGIGSINFDWEGGDFENSPYYVVSQTLNSSGYLLDQAQDFIIIQTAKTPEFPFIWILTFGLVVIVIVLAVAMGKRMKM